MLGCAAFSLCVVYMLQLAAGAATTSLDEFAVIIDVGSTGSRVYVFQYTSRDFPSQVPASITQVYNFKVKPGFSTLSLDKVKPYILQLLDAAIENVPEDSMPSTSLYFLATAGMRVIPEQTSNDLMAAADKIFSNITVNPFQYQSHSARVLAGEEEAAFGWIAVNYLRGHFTGDAALAGIIEMGGASAQIAFVPEGTPMSNLFPVKLNDIDYPLYAHSYLSYGANYAQQWMTQYLLQNQEHNGQVLEDPCMPRGYNETVYLAEVGEKVTVQGSSNAESCILLVDQFVYDVDPMYCHPEPCAIGPFYQPSLPEDMPFSAVEGFFYTAEDINAMFPTVFDANGHVSPAKLLQSALQVCDLEYDELLKKYGGHPAYSTAVCRNGVYYSQLMTEGYGFPEQATSITTASKINGESYNWAIGALIYG